MLKRIWRFLFDEPEWDPDSGRPPPRPRYYRELPYMPPRVSKLVPPSESWFEPAEWTADDPPKRE